MGSSGKSSSKSGGSAALEQIASEYWGETEGVRTEFFSQLESLLTTGGVGARLPIMAAAEERSRTASSEAMGATEKQLASTGLAGTPFGEQIRADQTMAGEQAAASSTTDILTQLLNQVAGVTTGSANTVISGLSVPEAQSGGKNFGLGF